MLNEPLMTNFSHHTYFFVDKHLKLETMTFIYHLSKFNYLPGVYSGFKGANTAPTKNVATVAIANSNRFSLFTEIESPSLTPIFRNHFATSIARLNNTFAGNSSSVAPSTYACFLYSNLTRHRLF